MGCLSRLSRGGVGRLEKKAKTVYATVRFNGEKCCFHPKDRNQIIICCAFASKDFPKLGHDTHNNHRIFHSTFILFLIMQYSKDKNSSTNTNTSSEKRQYQFFCRHGSLPVLPTPPTLAEKSGKEDATVSQHLGKTAHLSNG